MRAKQAVGLLAAILLVAAAAPVRAAPAGNDEVTGRIESVTVYRGQALVTRVVPVEGPAGMVEVVVTGLPERVIPDSIYADGEGGIAVRGVRYRTRAVAEEPRPEVRQLADQIEAVRKDIRAREVQQRVLEQREKYLQSLEQFSATKATDEVDKGTLNADSLVKLSQFLFEQRQQVAAGLFDIQEQIRDLQEQLQLLERKRQELAAAMTRTAREAILTLEKPGRGAGQVRLSYLVGGATWSPLYNLRAGGDRDQVGLEYNAQIQQTSGEDWQSVRLVLSTASPNMAAEAPILTPLWLTLSAQPPQGAQGAAEVLKRQSEALSNLRQAVEQVQAQGKRGRQQRAEPIEEGEWEANRWANSLQYLDLTAGKDILVVAREGRPADQVLSVNYELPNPISLPSRSDQQMVQIASVELPAEFRYVAAPLLTPYVYQQARVSNASEVALLEGPYSAYLDGQFMGTGTIPMVAKGQRFTVGFGVDSQLRAGRELADKKDQVQGGNRELTFTYRLQVENYKDKPVRIQLMDRLPEPRGADIRVTLVETSKPVSEDKAYQRTLRKQGILLWEVEVPARAADATAEAVEYTYRVEFDRNQYLALPTREEEERQRVEFNEQLDMFMTQ